MLFASCKISSWSNWATCKSHQRRSLLKEILLLLQTKKLGMEAYLAIICSGEGAQKINTPSLLTPITSAMPFEWQRNIVLLKRCRKTAKKLETTEQIKMVISTLLNHMDLKYAEGDRSHYIYEDYTSWSLNLKLWRWWVWTLPLSNWSNRNL